MSIKNERLENEVKDLRNLHAEMVSVLYGGGYELVGWHLNDDTQPLDDIFTEEGWITLESWRHINKKEDNV